MVRDAIAIVEAAYRLDRDDTFGWLEGVVEAASPLLSDGLGCFATIYDRDAANADDRAARSVVRGGDPRLPEALRAAFAAAPDVERRRACMITRPIATLTMLDGTPPRENPAYAALAKTIGFGDVITSNAENPDGTGCFLSAALARPCRTPNPEPWTRTSAHVAAGLRLRTVLGRLGAVRITEASEAIFSVDGRLLHAEAGAEHARRSLGRACKRIDRARGSLRRRDPEAALDGWSALVGGRWSLVDHVESDGKRLFLALANPPSSPDPRALTERERTVASYLVMGHSNKLIAYTLGISEATAAARTSTIFRKLGVRTRVELVARHLALSAARFTELRAEELSLMVGRAGAPKPLEALTAAEQAVAAMVARGMSNVAIARARSSSPRTVANQLARIYDKLGIASRAELTVRYASTTPGTKHARQRGS